MDEDEFLVCWCWFCSSWNASSVCLKPFFFRYAITAFSISSSSISLWGIRGATRVFTDRTYIHLRARPQESSSLSRKFTSFESYLFSFFLFFFLSKSFFIRIIRKEKNASDDSIMKSNVNIYRITCTNTMKSTNIIYRMVRDILLGNQQYIIIFK